MALHWICLTEILGPYAPVLLITCFGHIFQAAMYFPPSLAHVKELSDAGRCQ
jgi:hypothetical protein